MGPSKRRLGPLGKLHPTGKITRHAPSPTDPFRLKPKEGKIAGLVEKEWVAHSSMESPAPSSADHSENDLVQETGAGKRQRIGLLLAALCVLAIAFSAPLFGLSEAGTNVALLALSMACLWVTEAIPIPATALLPLVALPLLGVSPIRQAAAPYADPIIYLFMGGFMLALAMERWETFTPRTYYAQAICVLLVSS